MDACLGIGNRRTIKAQKELEQLKQQQQQQPPNQNYYTQQQTPAIRLPQPKRAEKTNKIDKTSQSPIIPQYTADCLQFPPPPQYPPSPTTSPTSKHLKQDARLQISPTSTAGTPTSPTNVVHYHAAELQGMDNSQSVYVEPNCLPTRNATAKVSPTSASYTNQKASVAQERRIIIPRYPDPDPDAIEICNEQDTHFTSGTSKMHRKHAMAQQCEEFQMAVKYKTLQHPAQAHDYSYAYYEPGVIMRHANIPTPEQVPGTKAIAKSIAATTSAASLPPTAAAPPPNSMRALLSKGKKNKVLVSPAMQQTFQARYNQLSGVNSADALDSMTSPSENFYEEISTQLRSNMTSQSVGSISHTIVEEELQRVQHRHCKILGELNLSIEAMLMPDSPPHKSPTRAEQAPAISVTYTSGEPATIGMHFGSASADNICDTRVSTQSQAHKQKPQQQVQSADMDSGFSGSSCTGSYIGSFRTHKSNASSTTQRHISAASVAPATDTCAFAYGSQTCRSFHRSKQSAQPADIGDTGFLMRASCGRRFLNCAKIRAFEDPGPMEKTESKARSFWARKGWRKQTNLSSSTTSLDNQMDLQDESKLNAGNWEDKLPANSSTDTNQSSLGGATTTTTTAQLHNIAAFRRIETVKPALTPTQQTKQNHRNFQSDKPSHNECLALTGSKIAGENFSTNGGTAAPVGVDSTTQESAQTKSTINSAAESTWQSEKTVGVIGNSLEEDILSEEEENSNSVSSSLSATNQRNSQLRSTFNKAKQHLSFDKWRSNSTQSGGTLANTLNTFSNADTNTTTNTMITRRASACTMPTAHREEITTPGESPGGRLSRWFSIRRGSTHQYDVGGRDGRNSCSSSVDLPDACIHSTNEQTASPQKLAKEMAASNARKMPGVPEYEDDEPTAAISTSRFDLDLIIPPGSRANGTARNAHARLITPMLPPPPAGLSQQQLKRRHIIAAIVHSENSYVATLQRLVNDYKKPLEESNPPVLSANKISTLFHRLPDILQSHKLFRIALAECVRNWDRDEKLGDCFVSSFSKPRILEIYSGFINNFSAAMELAKMEEKRKSALADFFKVKQISAHDRLSFFGLMVKPVQRFPQFILFLQDLLKYTPQGHHDRMSLQLALTQLELLAEMLNERKREAEQHQGFKEMLGHISGTFNTRSLTTTEGNRPRFLVREDNVTHLEFNQAGLIVKSKQRRLLLLNDKVICVSVAPKQSHDFGATEKLTFKWMYPVSDVEIVDNCTSATLSRLLTAGLNRGGSLKSNNSSCNSYGTNTLPANASPQHFANFNDSPATQLTNGAADNLCNEMSTLMYDYEVISRIHDLVGSLKGTYKELNLNTTRNLLNTIQTSIQRKDEEMAWVDSCCLQLVARNKSGKEETFTFQTQNPNVKKEWVTELRLAQLALDTNNSPAWETSTTDALHLKEQSQTLAAEQRQSNKMPLFVKAMPVYKSQHQTEVRCGCYYTIANDNKKSGNARRRHKQQNYLWICTSDGTSSHIAILSQHHQQAGNLRDVGAFDLVETQVTAMEFIKGLENCKTREEHNNLLGDLIWMGTDSRKILIYSAQDPQQEEQLGCCAVPGAVFRILYHLDAIYVALSNATIYVYRRSYDGAWLLKEPQILHLGESGLPVPSLLPINMNVYASCANRVYVLNALNGEIQKSFEVQHGNNQQVNLMAHSGIGLWISQKNSAVLCLYHTETFKHLQDINVAQSVLRNDSKKEQAMNNSSIYVTALMACKGLLWVGTNVGIAVTIPLPRLEGVPIISGGISMSCHAHFGPITFLLPLVPKVYPSYKSPPALTLPNSAVLTDSGVVQAPSMGEDLQLPAIDADPKKISDADLDESIVILRRDLPKDETGSGTASPSSAMLRDLNAEADSNTSSPRSSKLDKQNSLDQSFSAKIRASLANSPAFHRKRFRDLSSDSVRMSKTLPRGFNTAQHSNTSTLNHSEHGYCDVYGLYGKLIFVKEDYDADETTQGNLMDMMYEGMRRSDPELAAIPGKVSTLDRRLRMKASRPRSLDLSNWSVDSKSSSLYTSSGSEESMGIRLFGGRSVSRNSSSASHKTSGNGSDLGNISENGLMTNEDIQQHSTPKSDDGFKAMEKNAKATNAASTATAHATNANSATTPAAAAVVATLKRKQKQTTKQQQNADGPRTIITLTGGRGYWRHVWYTHTNSPGHKASISGASGGSGASSPLIANSNDAHIVVWEKKL